LTKADEEPLQPTIDPQIQKADKIIDKVGLQEVREVLEIEIDPVPTQPDESHSPNDNRVN